ncbi:uncharacterized protein AB675_1334 [Cyphellophora attinorum]|uniref:Uncharacterized protein n=1 Tax=Cyphellophora attinorum TaxID=1664694 RepID=A0A0N1GXP8_9EURO|nr:uncharacterized protein AB675_1334 [Phialophora attinorum]KPI35113.1 hypothetical protein AB675_1334 [Phialophora attinorum]
MEVATEKSLIEECHSNNPGDAPAHSDAALAVDGAGLPSGHRPEGIESTTDTAQLPTHTVGGALIMDGDWANPSRRRFRPKHESQDKASRISQDPELVSVVGGLSKSSQLPSDSTNSALRANVPEFIVRREVDQFDKSNCDQAHAELPAVGQSSHVSVETNIARSDARESTLRAVAHDFVPQNSAGHSAAHISSLHPEALEFVPHTKVVGTPPHKATPLRADSPLYQSEASDLVQPGSTAHLGTPELAPGTGPAIDAQDHADSTELLCSQGDAGNAHGPDCLFSLDDAAGIIVSFPETSQASSAADLDHTTQLGPNDQPLSAFHLQQHPEPEAAAAVLAAALADAVTVQYRDQNDQVVILTGSVKQPSDAECTASWQHVMAMLDPNIHHFNWRGQPVVGKTTTKPATSLAVLQATKQKYSLCFDGALDDRRQLLIELGLCYVDPVIFSGDQTLLTTARGTALENAAIGVTEKYYTPHGRWSWNELSEDEDRPVVGDLHDHDTSEQNVLCADKRTKEHVIFHGQTSICIQKYSDIASENVFNAKERKKQEKADEKATLEVTGPFPDEDGYRRSRLRHVQHVDSSEDEAGATESQSIAAHTAAKRSRFQPSRTMSVKVQETSHSVQAHRAAISWADDEELMDWADESEELEAFAAQASAPSTGVQTPASTCSAASSMTDQTSLSAGESCEHDSPAVPDARTTLSSTSTDGSEGSLCKEVVKHFLDSPHLEPTGLEDLEDGSELLSTSVDDEESEIEIVGDVVPVTAVLEVGPVQEEQTPSEVKHEDEDVVLTAASASEVLNKHDSHHGVNEVLENTVVAVDNEDATSLFVPNSHKNLRKPNLAPTEPSLTVQLCNSSSMASLQLTRSAQAHFEGFSAVHPAASIEIDSQYDGEDTTGDGSKVYAQASHLNLPHDRRKLRLVSGGSPAFEEERQVEGHDSIMTDISVSINQDDDTVRGEEQDAIGTSGDARLSAGITVGSEIDAATLQPAGLDVREDLDYAPKVPSLSASASLSRVLHESTLDHDVDRAASNMWRKKAIPAPTKKNGERPQQCSTPKKRGSSDWGFLEALQSTPPNEASTRPQVPILPEIARHLAQMGNRNGETGLSQQEGKQKQGLMKRVRKRAVASVARVRDGCRGKSSREASAEDKKGVLEKGASMVKAFFLQKQNVLHY